MRSLTYYCRIFCLLSMFFVTSAFAMTPPSGDVPTDVNIGLYIFDVTNIDERNQTLTVEATLYLAWQDKRVLEKLNITGEQYFQDAQAQAVLEQIWWPYVRILHLQGTRTKGSLLLKVTEAGELEYHERMQIQVETKIDMRRFPFDKQTLNIIFQPFYDHYPSINFKSALPEEGVRSGAHSAQWLFEGYTSSIRGVANEAGTYVLPDYELQVNYKRKSGFYVLNVFGPMLLIMLVSWSVFWLWKQAYINRVALIKTALLAVLVFQWVVYGEEPRVPYHTFFDSFVFWSFLVLAMSAVILIVSYNLPHYLGKRLEWHSRWLVPLVYFLGIGGLVLIFF